MKNANEGLNILVIEDNQGDYFLIENCLIEKFPFAKICNASTYKDALNAIVNASNKPEIIFLDLSLPDNSGEKLINDIVGLNLEIPIIVLTGYSDFNFGIKSLTLGVSDYLLKDEINPTNLSKSIFYSLERQKQFIKLKHSQDDFQSLFYLSPSGMWIVDIVTFKIIDVNNAALEIFGNFKDIFQSKSLKDILPKTEFKNLKESITILNDRLVVNFKTTFKYLRDDKSEADLEIDTTAIDYQGNRAILIITNDITERQNQFNAVKDQNKKLKDIAWLQSHIVRAPLSRILGLCNLIESFDEFKKNKDLKQMIGYLTKSANDLDQAIKKITSKSGTTQDFSADFSANEEF